MASAVVPIHTHGTTRTGRDLQSGVYVKLLTQDMKHYTFTWQVGENVDTNPFTNYYGLYFCSVYDLGLHYLRNGVFSKGHVLLGVVSVDADEPIRYNAVCKTYCAHRVTLSNVMPLFDHPTLLYHINAHMDSFNYTIGTLWIDLVRHHARKQRLGDIQIERLYDKLNDKAKDQVFEHVWSRLPKDAVIQRIIRNPLLIQYVDSSVLGRISQVYKLDMIGHWPKTLLYWGMDDLNILGARLVIKTKPWSVKLMFDRLEDMKARLDAVRTALFYQGSLLGWALQRLAGQLSDQQTDDLIVAALTRGGRAIRHVERQQEWMQLMAVQRDGHALRWCRDPSDDVILAALRQNGHAIRWVHEQTKDRCLQAVYQNPFSIKHMRRAARRQGGVCVAAVVREPMVERHLGKNWDYMVSS